MCICTYVHMHAYMCMPPESRMHTCVCIQESICMLMDDLGLPQSSSIPRERHGVQSFAVW